MNSAASSKIIQLVLVVETDEISQTDDVYYTYLLRSFFGDYVGPALNGKLSIVFNFVHVGGTGEFKSQKAKAEINGFVRGFHKGQTRVVYCADYDNKGQDTAKRLDTLRKLCEQKGYYLSLAYKEIEDVCQCPRKGLSKKDMAKIFGKNYPKKGIISPRSVFCEDCHVTDRLGQTNFGKVIDRIIEEALGEKDK